MAESQEQKEKKKKRLALQSKYTQRITIAKNGREAFLQKDYVTATKKYTEYLGILSELNELEDVYSLKPSMFDPNKDVTELLLISHVYWEMARINEMTPKLQATYKKCLAQFVKFTINQPYQVFNSEMLRKYIKKNKRKSIQLSMLNEAYSQIFVQSRKCYIATFCFGEESKEVIILRKFKNDLLAYSFGRKLVSFYYKNSFKLVTKLEKNNIKNNYFIKTSKLLIGSIAKLLERKY